MGRYIRMFLFDFRANFRLVNCYRMYKFIDW
jgi:hypothetical protein